MWNSIYKESGDRKKEKLTTTTQMSSLYAKFLSLHSKMEKKNPALFLNADYFSFVLTFVPLAMCLKKCKVDLDCMLLYIQDLTLFTMSNTVAIRH